MSKSKGIREEFEKAFLEQFHGVIVPSRIHALWASRWMAERISKVAKHNEECNGRVWADEIEAITKELGDSQ